MVRWLEGGGEAEAAATVGAIAAAARGEHTVTWRGLFNPRVVPLRTPHMARTPDWQSPHTPCAWVCHTGLKPQSSSHTGLEPQTSR